MAYTTDDLSAVQAAIIELATGKRVVKIAFSNGETTEYAASSINALKVLRSDIQGELNSANNVKRYFRTVTSKGL